MRKPHTLGGAGKGDTEGEGSEEETRVGHPPQLTSFISIKNKGKSHGGGNATSFLFLQENKRGEPEGKECHVMILFSNKKGENKKGKKCHEKGKVFLFFS
jgi:hypothetical protein